MHIEKTAETKARNRAKFLSTMEERVSNLRVQALLTQPSDSPAVLFSTHYSRLSFLTMQVSSHHCVPLLFFIEIVKVVL